MADVNACGNALTGLTGTGNFVGSNTPTLITPVLGVATATSINFGGGALSAYTPFTAWTPTFTFATPGDLSFAYSLQVGEYWRIGNQIVALYTVSGTATFTTSSGAVQITGLPVAANSSFGGPGVARFSGTGHTLPAGTTYLNSSLSVNASLLTFLGSGSGIASASMAATNITSGVAFLVIGCQVYSA